MVKNRKIFITLIAITLCLCMGAVMFLSACGEEESTNSTNSTTVKLTKENCLDYLILTYKVDAVPDGVIFDTQYYREKFSGTIVSKRNNYTFNDVEIGLMYNWSGGGRYVNKPDHTCLLTQDGNGSFVFYGSSGTSVDYHTEICIYSVSGTVVID